MTGGSLSLVGGTAEAGPFPVDDGLLPPILTSKSTTLGWGTLFCFDLGFVNSAGGKGGASLGRW
jgi:hypothetical protein